MTFPRLRSPRFSFARVEPAAPVAGAMEGTASIGFGHGSSALTGAGALAGSSALAFGHGSSALRGAGAMAGAAALVFTAQAVAQALAAISGAAALSFANSGALDGAGALAGAAAMVFSGAGALVGAGALAGAAAMVFSNAGVLRAAGALAGAAALTFTPLSSLDGAGRLAGESALVFGGSLNPGGALQGSAALQFATAGALRGSAALAGSAGVVFSPLAVLQGAGAVSGAAAMQFDVTGTLRTEALFGTITLLFGDGDSTLTGSGGGPVLRRNTLFPPVYDWAAASALLQSMLGSSLPMRFYRHGRAPQDVAAGTLDYVTWFAFTAPENTLSEDPGMDRVTVQFDCWVRGGVDAEERVERLAQEVQRVFEQHGHCTGIPVDERDDVTKKFRIGLTFDIMWPRWAET